ncbi:hypothetical protein RFI_25229 [Reticulomyxa filosa]|uniref:Uncharacterized protein n=1 Tax=Reticulomyxa filosa TaxID=46433 RepID=X6MFE8_RETFI|nr:hypothetical protein RFI_25229 [Reticulomyxa filosa]|eukprot:ETO12147.1 hypothetical protein RFI_25229 [Reticulomyxa filosa]
MSTISRLNNGVLSLLQGHFLKNFFSLRFSSFCLIFLSVVHFDYLLKMANFFSLVLTFGLVFSSLSSTTTASLQLTNDCNYVFYDAPYSVGVCWNRQDSTGKKTSVKFTCNTDKNITYQEWEKASCSGTASKQQSLIDFAISHNISTSSLKWKCDAKSGSKCSAYERDYNFSSSATSCKNTNGFSDVTFALNTCVGYDTNLNKSMAITCANGNITMFYFNNLKCTPSPDSNNYTYGSNCGGMSGKYYQTSVRCGASPVSVAIALLFAVISLVFS